MTEWMSAAWDATVSFFDQARIVPFWEWLLTNPGASELGHLTGVLWTAMAWNLAFLLIFRLTALLKPWVRWIVLPIYLFFTAGLFVLSQATATIISSARTVPGADWLGDQVLLVWLFVFLALFMLIAVVGHYVAMLGKIAWIANLVLIWMVYATEAVIYKADWTIWGLCIVGMLSGLWIVVNMLKVSGGK